MAAAAVFAAVFCALYAAHTVGDHWIQTHHQACAKGGAGWRGRIACAAHVATLTLTKAVALAALVLVLGVTLDPRAVILALAVDAVSHYWADRRITLRRLARRIGKGDFYEVGQSSRCLGTGAYALDQSWHVLFLFIAALVIAGGGA